MCPTHVIGHVCSHTAQSPLRGLAALFGIGMRPNPPRFESPRRRSQRQPAGNVAPPGTKEALNPHSCRAAANASGFLQVSLSKMSRRAAFPPCPSTSAPRHFRSRLATTRQVGSFPRGRSGQRSILFAATSVRPLLPRQPNTLLPGPPPYSSGHTCERRRRQHES